VTPVHYCKQLRALLVRIGPLGFDLYRSGLTLWLFTRNKQHAIDFGKVGQ
jgi:hypothetical protein